MNQIKYNPFLPKFNDKFCSKQKSHGLSGHDAKQNVKCYLWNDGQKSTTSKTKMRATQLTFDNPHLQFLLWQDLFGN